MQEDLISVIVPVYKVEKYIERCLDSIINQTHKNLEIILIDDGSPDASGKICDEYAEKDNRIKVVHNKNGGVCVARNTGLDLASGDYISFIDPDDWIENDTYEKVFEKLKEEDVEIVRFNYYKDTQTESVVNKFIFEEDVKINLIENRENIFELFLNGRMHAGICFSIIKKSLIDNIAKFDSELALGEDLLFDMELMCIANSIFFYNQCFYHYYTNVDSCTKSISYTERNIRHLSLLYFKILNLFKKYNFVSQKKIKQLSYLIFDKIFTQLFIGFKKPYIKRLTDFIVFDESVIEIFKNVEYSDLKIIQKIFLFLLKREKRNIFYYYCICLSCGRKIKKKFS